VAASVAREAVDGKARRYLVEGRLTIARVDAAAVEASCRGGGAVYELGHDGEQWWCSCPARGRCAHLMALGLVVVRAAGADEGRGDAPEPEVTVPVSSGAELERDDEEPEVTPWL
jgi:uncharacterized Zn finger protein